MANLDGFFMRLLEKPLFHYKDGEEVPGPLQRTGDAIQDADFFIAVRQQSDFG